MDTENRSKALEIAARAKSDPTYLAELQKDPEATLSAAGLPEVAVVEFMREDGLGDVSGYSMGFNSAPPEECLCTGCCVTNIIIGR
jgi:hypothetical protein